MQILDPLANTTQVGNATRPALSQMRGLQQGVGTGVPNPLFTNNPNYYEGQGMKDLRYFPKTLGQGMKGGMSGNEYDFMVDGNSQGYNFTGDGLTEQAKAGMRQQQGITANLGGGMDRGNPSNVDRSFAQALGALSDREQAEIISATQGMTTDEQIDNFKRQYLQGRISPYELEAQSNLGF